MAGLDRIATRATTQFLSAFSNALPDPAVVSPKISRQVFEKFCTKVTRKYCWTISNCCANSVPRAWTTNLGRLRALRALPFLPSLRNARQFLEQTHAALAHLDWKQHALELANVARDWSQRLDAKFSRALFALAGRNGCERRCRPLSRRRPSVCARAVAYRGAGAKSKWSHLILAGWNEGPGRRRPARVARAEEIRAFNRSVQQLNKRAARQEARARATPVCAKTIRYLRARRATRDRVTAVRCAPRIGGTGVTLAASLVGRCAGTLLEERTFYRALSQNAR